MGVRYVYDTNIVIYHLGGEPAVEQYFAEDFLQKNEVATNAIIRIELLSYPDIKKEEEIAIRELLEQFAFIPLSEEVEMRTIHIRRTTSTKIPDAIIAATAQSLDATLVTRNTSDFDDIQGLRLLNPF
jgi:predicted nucleic acid-binding protein